MIAPFRAFPSGLTWSADDKKLIYSLYQREWALSELGEVTVANGSVKRLAFAGGAVLPTVSPKGDKLAYSSLSISSNIWRRDLLHPESPAVELIPSSRAQCDAQYSPDGKRIAFASLRSGVQGVWISNDDGSNLVQISNPNYVSGSPQWSPDGNKIAFDSRPRDRWEIYVADVAERKAQKTGHKYLRRISTSLVPRWKVDLFHSPTNLAGRESIVVPPPAETPFYSPKISMGSVRRSLLMGRQYILRATTSKSTLKKVALPAQPGTESEVDGLPRVSHGRTFGPSLQAVSILFLPRRPDLLRYFDFASKQIRPIFEVDKDFGSGLSVSPDGRWILYSLVDVNGDIMLVDHFH